MCSNMYIFTLYYLWTQSLVQIFCCHTRPGLGALGTSSVTIWGVAMRKCVAVAVAMAVTIAVAVVVVVAAGVVVVVVVVVAAIVDPQKRIGESRKIIAQSWYSACLMGNSMGIDSAAYETITVLGVRRGGTVFYTHCDKSIADGLPDHVVDV